jgi:hypothetical protein
LFRERGKEFDHDTLPSLPIATVVVVGPVVTVVVTVIRAMVVAVVMTVGMITVTVTPGRCIAAE